MRRRVLRLRPSKRSLITSPLKKKVARKLLRRVRATVLALMSLRSRVLLKMLTLRKRKTWRKRLRKLSLRKPNVKRKKRKRPSRKSSLLIVSPLIVTLLIAIHLLAIRLKVRNPKKKNPQMKSLERVSSLKVSLPIMRVLKKRVKRMRSKSLSNSLSRNRPNNSQWNKRNLSSNNNSIKILRELKILRCLSVVLISRPVKTTSKNFSRSVERSLMSNCLEILMALQREEDLSSSKPMRQSRKPFS